MDFINFIKTAESRPISKIGQVGGQEHFCLIFEVKE
jgi:hypothetical protein